MNKHIEKLFVIRKYIMATSVQAALRKDKKAPVDDCWLDEDYKKNMARDLTPAIGFTHDEEDI